MNSLQRRMMGGQKIPYILRDDFSDTLAAGNLNLTLATDGKSARYVYDPNTLLSMSGGNLVISSVATVAEDLNPGLWYDSFPRGYVIAATVTPQTGNYRAPDHLGWYTVPVSGNNDYDIGFIAGGTVYVRIYGMNVAVGSWTANTTYQVIIYAYPGVGGEIWIKGGTWTGWTKVHTDATRTTLLMFPAISYYVQNLGAKATIDNFIVSKFSGSQWDKYFIGGGAPRTTVPIAFFGDSKSVTGTSCWPGLLNTTAYVFQEVPTGKWVSGFNPNRMATNGATVASRTSTIVANLAAITDTTVPKYVLWNLGTNDVVSMPTEATFKANAQTCIDAIHTKWASAKIYFMRVWHRGYAASCNTLDGWYADLVASNPGVCFLGPDERVFLENGDDGATYTVDGIHPTTPAGYALTAANWRAVLGY